MIHDGLESSMDRADGTLDDGQNQLDKTLIVKRTKLTFNDKECIVLNFQDISTI